jgi:hypothetical protein
VTDGSPFKEAAARGVVAAMAMTGMRKLTTGLGLVEQIPPEMVAEEGVPSLFARVPEAHRDEVVEVMHWAYGGVGGAVFGVLPRGFRRHRWAGPVYGLAVWLGFEAGIAPLLGLKGARQWRLAERAALAADHVLYGLVVAARPSRN